MLREAHMAIRYWVDRPGGYVHTEVSGTLEPSAAVEHLQALRADPEIDPAMPRLIDLRPIQEDALASPEARSIVYAIASVETAGAAAVPGRRALVSGSDLVFEMARTFATLTEGGAHEYRAFRSLEEALRWLGVARPGQGSPGPTGPAPDEGPGEPPTPAILPMTKP